MNIEAQSTRVVGPGPFSPEDYAFTAKLLRRNAYDIDHLQWFHAVCSNNLNIILAALDAISEDVGGAP
jgi:hypothetical protein